MKMKLKRGEAIDLRNAIACARDPAMATENARGGVFMERLLKLSLKLHKHVKKIEKKKS